MTETAEIVGDKIVVRGVTKAEMKTLGASVAGDAWTLPATRSNARAIRDVRPELPDLSDALTTPYTPLEDGRLYDYQRDAAGRLVEAPHGLLLCLSPGLGKTAVSIVAADHVVPDEQVVVVAPASLLLTWEREIQKWGTGDTSTYVVRGALDPDLGGARWIIVSWDKAAREAARLTKLRWPLWILDESVLAKSRSSKRFKALAKARARVDRFWLLSGNPITRYADDLWAQLHLLWPSAFKSFWRFAERYCIVEDTTWARVVAGTRHGRDVAEENSDLVMVVNQEDVLDLPEYLFETVDVALLPKQRDAYESMESDFIAELDGTEVVAANEVARLQKLQQIASYWDGASAKHEAIAELIGSYEGPHLIWTHWKEGGVALAERLGFAVVNGDTPSDLRDKYLEEFKAGDREGIVLSLGVGKFGHTFTNTKTVWYVDRTWNADDHFQSLHRVRRIGLKHRPVVITLHAPGTVDELVEENLSGKYHGISRLTKSDLKKLLKAIGGHR